MTGLDPERRELVERRIAAGYTLPPHDARALLETLQAAEQQLADAQLELETADLDHEAPA